MPPKQCARLVLESEVPHLNFTHWLSNCLSWLLI